MVALGVAPSAQANTNLVPNPSFESDCSGVPCNWVAAFGASILRDPTHGVASPASMKVTLTGASSEGGASSSCVNMGIAAGAHDAFLWYLTANALVASVELAARFFSGANCTGIHTDVGQGTQTTDDGGWHAFQTTMTSPAASSVVFALNMTTFTPGTTPSVNFDLIDFESELLAVTVSSFTATRSHKGILVRWRTGTEVNELGFNVFRQRGGKRVRLNRRLLPALGAVAGSSYSFLDRRAPRHRAPRYWLQDVDLTGARTWHGPVRAAAS